MKNKILEEFEKNKKSLDGSKISLCIKISLTSIADINKIISNMRSLISRINKVSIRTSNLDMIGFEKKIIFSLFSVGSVKIKDLKTSKKI